MTDTRANPARTGLALVVTAGTILAASVWWLPGTRADKSTAVVMAAVMALCATAWYAGTHSVQRPYALLGYSMILFVGLGAIGASTTQIAWTYSGFFTMAFIFMGLYVPARPGFLMLPPAAVSWLFANGAITGSQSPIRSMEVRLPLAVVIWALVVSLLSQHSAATTRSATSLMNQAQRDPLTGLHNRRVLNDVLAAAVPRDVLILIDIDHFKTVNDERGHNAGDELLTNFARILVRDIRENDIAVRFGGDEFLLYLPTMSIETAETVLERFHLDWSRQPDTASFSAGIAAVREGRDGADAFAEADRLLYDAKAAGRNQWSAHPVASSPTIPAQTPVSNSR